MRLALLLLLLTIPAFAANAPLTTSCFPCAPGEPITITGSGFHGGGNHELTVIVWGDSNDPISCSTTKGGDFNCVVSIANPGWYNIMAYSNSKTVIGVAGMLVE